MAAEPRLYPGVSHDRGTIEGVQAQRRALGVDRFDEVSDGELRMHPPPISEHSRIDSEHMIVLGELVKVASEALGASSRKLERGALGVSVEGEPAQKVEFSFRRPAASGGRPSSRSAPRRRASPRRAHG
jgi:hypothetical protein